MKGYSVVLGSFIGPGMILYEQAAGGFPTAHHAVTWAIVNLGRNYNLPAPKYIGKANGMPAGICGKQLSLWN